MEQALGRNEVSPRLVKLFARSEARGIFISSYSYTEPAITRCKDAMPLKTLVLCSLEETAHVLEQQASLKDLLKEKVRAAVIDKNPLFRRAS